MMAALPLPAEVGRQPTGFGEPPPMTAEGSIAHTPSYLLAAFFEQMNAAQIPYCLLNGFQGYPDVVASDVDFMVHPSNAERIAPLLLEVAARCGALLVQAIRHEIGAWYFVLAKQEGCAVTYLHPDCSTDYRRDGRLWLEADQVLQKRRPYKTFFVPAIADEFLYYLTKKVLKQRITGAQWQRIAALYLSRAEECSERIRRFWSEETAKALVLALERQDIGWMGSYLPALLSELRASVPAESWWQRVKQRAREWRRRLERAVNPTGLSIAVCGGTEQQREQLAVALEQNLRPAFRRTMICAEDTGSEVVLGAARLWLAKVRSTLVIRKKESVGTEWLVRDDIDFVLSDSKVGEAIDGRHGGNVRNLRVALDGGRALERSLELAIRIALEHLAARLQRRMKLREPSRLTARGVE